MRARRSGRAESKNKEFIKKVETGPLLNYDCFGILGNIIITFVGQYYVVWAGFGRSLIRISISMGIISGEIRADVNVAHHETEVLACSCTPVISVHRGHFLRQDMILNIIYNFLLFFLI